MLLSSAERGAQMAWGLEKHEGARVVGFTDQ